MRVHNARTDRVCLATRRARGYTCPCKPPAWGELKTPQAEVHYDLGLAHRQIGDEIRCDGRHTCHTYQRMIDRAFPIVPPYSSSDVVLRKPDISLPLGGALYAPWWDDAGPREWPWQDSYSGTGLLPARTMLLWRYVSLFTYESFSFAHNAACTRKWFADPLRLNTHPHPIRYSQTVEAVRRGIEQTWICGTWTHEDVHSMPVRYTHCLHDCTVDGSDYFVEFVLVETPEFLDGASRAEASRLACRAQLRSMWRWLP